MKIKRISLKNNNTFLMVLKGSLNALIFSLISILIFAFIIKLTSVSDGLIKPINQIIKIVSIFFGCFVALKHNNEKSFFKGAIIGGAYILLAFILFSALNGKFEFSVSILFDLIFGAVVGIICAIICNIFRRK